MCRPTRQRYRGRLVRLGEMSEDYAQPLHRGSGGSTYTRKAPAFRTLLIHLNFSRTLIASCSLFSAMINPRLLFSIISYYGNLFRQGKHIERCKLHTLTSPGSGRTVQAPCTV